MVSKAKGTSSSREGGALIGVELGNYRVEAKIAEGGMGIIYRAVHTVIGRKAAIKVLSERYSNDQNMIKRLHREARAVNRIGHPSIVDIFDFGRTPDGRQYFAMEYLEGKSLAQLLESEEPPPWSLSQKVLVDTLDALGAAHDLGIVHRDVKPENILVIEKEGGEIQTKILDFGIAKSIGLGPEGEQLTRAGSVMGTPEYIAPEQIRGKQVDGRADLYAMGVILYELVTGHRPFDSDKVMTLLMSHLRDPVPPIDNRSGAPEQALAAIPKAMAKKPEDRFQDAREFAQALGLSIGTVTAADGTRALPDLFWEMDGSQDPSADRRSPTLPGSGIRQPPGGLPTAVGAAADTRHPPAGQRPTSRRKPLLWVVPLVLLGLSAALIAYVSTRVEGTKGAANSGATSKPSGDLAGAGLKAPRAFPKVPDIQQVLHLVRKALREAIDSSSPEVRRRAVRGLGDLRDTDLRRKLVKTIKVDPDPSVQATAALALVDLGDPAAKQDLINLRDEVSETVAVAVDDALMRLGHASSRSALLKMLSSPSRPVRTAAAMALARVGEKAATRVLEPEVRAGGTRLLVPLLTALARLDRPEARQSLRRGAAKEDPLTGLQFAEALAKLGDELALAPLRRLLGKKELAFPPRLRAAKSLASMGDYTGLDLMNDGIRIRAVQTRMLAADALGAIEGRSAMPALVSVLHDESLLVRTAAAQSLAHIFGSLPTTRLRRSQDWVVAMLEQGDWATRYAAIGVSAEMDPEVAVELLGWAFAGEKNPRIRAAILAKLSRFRSSKKALGYIRSGLGAASEEVRRAAMAALVASGTADRETLGRMVRDPSPAVRIAAAGALLKGGDPRMFGALKRVLGSRNPTLRAHAVAALGETTDPRALPLLQAALKDRAPQVAVAAALALASKGDRRAVPVLATAAKDGGRQSLAAIAALERLGVRQAETVRQLARSPSPRGRAVAMSTALGALPQKEALALLRKGADDHDPLVRRAAAREVGHVAAKDARSLQLLRSLSLDPDLAVRSIASMALARIETAKGGPRGGLPKLTPARKAPEPAPPKLPSPAPVARKSSNGSPPGSLDLLQEQSRTTSFNRAFTGATVAASNGQYRTALALLTKARRLDAQATGPIYEMGYVHLKLAIRDFRDPARRRRVKRNLDAARRSFAAYLQRAPNGKLAEKARKGLRDCKRLRPSAP